LELPDFQPWEMQLVQLVQLVLGKVLGLEKELWLWQIWELVTLELLWLVIWELL